MPLIRSQRIRWFIALIAGFVLGWFSHPPTHAPAPSDTSESADATEDRGSASVGSVIERKTTAIRRETSKGRDEKPDHSMPLGGIESGEHPNAKHELNSSPDTSSESSLTTTQKALFSSEQLATSHPAKPSENDLAKLHNAYRVSCQFDPGFSALLGSGLLTTANSNWQGGPITYDVIDADAGRATMNGTIGATGSPGGTVDAQILKGAAGLSFSTVTPRGDLVVTTLFSERNNRGEFLATMSTHGSGTGHVASQFYGSCDVL